ncbi:TPA: DUF1983 domain-containing protein [Salmonella enterica subsp. diarizonae serovar 61:r:-]
MGKGGGKGHTPYETPDNLKSSQLLAMTDAVSEGPIKGPVKGMQSILINNTPLVNADGSYNFHGVTVVYRVGEQPQAPLEGFEDSGAETLLGVELKHDKPVTRTITSKNIDRLRFTFGVQSLEETTDKGDRNESSVNMQIQLQQGGIWVTVKDIYIHGKTTTQFLASVVLSDLPPRPFNIRMVRVTPDSTSDMLQNKTLWSSYTEIIDIKQTYPNTAVAGLQVDAEQFGSQQVTVNYHLQGMIVQVPSNYDPDTRTYAGIWDGAFKPAYTNNPAWCVLDMLTHPRYGMGKHIGISDVDKWALYAIAQYCDQLVPDGFGGQEPRMTLNAYLANQRKAYDVLTDFCSVMRCMPVWNGSTMTFVQDRPSDNDYAGASVGGRITDLDITTRTLTLDREITLPESGTAMLNIVGPDGEPFSTEIQSQPAPDRVVLKVLPDNMQPYSVWGLKLPSLKRRLFRCVAIREGENNTYAITAVQHVPEKESIVDNGAHFDPLPGTTNSIIPPAVQHLVVDTDTDNSLYQAKAKWDTPRVVKGVRFILRLTTGSGKDGDPVRLVTTVTISEMQYAFHELPPGDYTLTVRAINGFGQQGDPASVTFSIQAPEAPTTIELTPGYFQITVTPHQTYYHPDVQYEFWYSATQLATAADIQSKAQYLGTGQFWIKDNIKPLHDAWFYVRSVNLVGKSAFAEASGQPSTDAEGYLEFFNEKIQKTQLAKELWEQVDNSELKGNIAEISKAVDDTKSEIAQTVNKTLEKQTATISQIQKVQKDTNDDLSALYMLKVQKTEAGVPYIAGIGVGIEDTEGSPLSQILLAANRIAFIDPANGNTTPMLVAQGDQILMNEALIKYLSVNGKFIVTPDGKMTATEATISGHINANSGTLSDVHILNSCQIDGHLSVAQIDGDIAKTYVLAGNSVYIPPQMVAMNLVALVTEKQGPGVNGSIIWDNADIFFNGVYQSPVASSAMSLFISGHYTTYTGGHGGGGGVYTRDLNGRIMAKVYFLPAGVPTTISCSKFAVVWMSKA